MRRLGSRTFPIAIPAPSIAVPAELQARFEENGKVLGYALLLRGDWPDPLTLVGIGLLVLPLLLQPFGNAWVRCSMSSPESNTRVTSLLQMENERPPKL